MGWWSAREGGTGQPPVPAPAAASPAPGPSPTGPPAALAAGRNGPADLPTPCMSGGQWSRAGRLGSVLSTRHFLSTRRGHMGVGGSPQGGGGLGTAGALRRGQLRDRKEGPLGSPTSPASQRDTEGVLPPHPALQFSPVEGESKAPATGGRAKHIGCLRQTCSWTRRGRRPSNGFLPAFVKWHQVKSQQGPSGGWGRRVAGNRVTGQRSEGVPRTLGKAQGSS